MSKPVTIKAKLSAAYTSTAITLVEIWTKAVALFLSKDEDGVTTPKWSAIVPALVATVVVVALAVLIA